MLVPPALAPGAKIRVIAPSGPFDPELLARGLARLSDYELLMDPLLAERRSGFLAAPDAHRLQELQQALDEIDTSALWIARGGYGISRLLGELRWDRFAQRPKWLVGFSDTTALHAALWARGIQSLHAANGTTLAECTPAELTQTLSVLSAGPPSPHQELITIVGGMATGPLVGGNLTVLFAEAAAGRLVLPEGCILFLEDVTETSYRVDRMLRALWENPVMRACAGLVFGSFTDCSPGKFQVATDEVLDSFARFTGLPSVRGLPVGHGTQNAPLPLGRSALLEAQLGKLSFSLD